jgi:hypothetical protein
VVGGMVWCLELCAVDVDVNFLFRENLNIGEKMYVWNLNLSVYYTDLFYLTFSEITEKIINVLLSIKCAYALEPHQIQGLDTVKILPVMQVNISFTHTVKAIGHYVIGKSVKISGW